MRKQLLTLFVAFIVSLPSPSQEVVTALRPKASGGGGGALVVRCSTTYDPGAAAGAWGLASGCTANAGDLIVVTNAVTSTTGSGNGQPTTVCDGATAMANCSSSTDTFTIGTTTCESPGSSICTSVAWTCNATSGVKYVGATLSSSFDQSYAVLDITHNVTSGCHDASAAATVLSALATLTSSAYTTATTQEIAIGVIADDNNCSTGFTGTAGTGFTLVTLASACASMLNASEYQIYSSIQTSVTASINTGTSAGNPLAMSVETFK